MGALGQEAVKPAPALTSVSPHERVPRRQAGVSQAEASLSFFSTQLLPPCSQLSLPQTGQDSPNKTRPRRKSKRKASLLQALQHNIGSQLARWYPLDLLGQLRDLATENTDFRGQAVRLPRDCRGSQCKKWGRLLLGTWEAVRVCSDSGSPSITLRKEVRPSKGEWLSQGYTFSEGL